MFSKHRTPPIIQEKDLYKHCLVLDFVYTEEEFLFVTATIGLQECRRELYVTEEEKPSLDVFLCAFTLKILKKNFIKPRRNSMLNKA